MISFATDQPLQEAVDKLGKRTPIGTMLSSRQWEGLPVQIRDASFFSSRVMSERILVEAQKRILQRIKLERDKAEAGGRVMERGRFITEMKDVLHSLGYEPDPDKKGSVQDLSYARRLGLIWQMQIDQAQGYAKWKTSQDPDILEAVPAMELVRGKQRRSPSRKAATACRSG